MEIVESEKQNNPTMKQTLLKQLEEANSSLEAARRELSEEKAHACRLVGYNSLAKKETINHVLSAVRRGVIHRLENIRGYADREKPNRDEILSLVREIEEHLAGIEDEIGV